MTRNRLIRRVLIPASAGTVGLLLAVQPASAQRYPRVSVYTLTPTEYFNACPLGPGSGITDYDGGAGNTATGQTLDCARGIVSYTSPSNF
ncbi:MAG: hypothetical protein R2761_24565 [Acidimicrobiales bacterium]